MATARAPLLFCDTRNANLIPALPVCVSACYSRGIIGPRIGVMSPVYHAVESSSSAQSAGSVCIVNYGCWAWKATKITGILENREKSRHVSKSCKTSKRRGSK